MIKNKLSEVMGRERMKISDVINATGLARNTVAELYHDRAKRIDLDTVNKLCVALNCQDISEIFEYVPEEAAQ